MVLQMRKEQSRKVAGHAAVELGIGREEEIPVV